MFMVVVTAILEMLFILLYKSMRCRPCTATYGTARFGAAFFAGDRVDESAAPMPPPPGRTSITGFLLRENIQSHFIKPAES
jgi:isopenicillin N synthase-like dioxygenase